MAPYPNIIERVELEKKIRAFKLKCKDCGEEYWTLWDLRKDPERSTFTDYVAMKKQYEENQERLKELNKKAKQDVHKLREQREELLKEYKGSIKFKRQLKKIIQSNT